jgi:probable O-glycosylation ligase (exosortase A-associated)
MNPHRLAWSSIHFAEIVAVVTLAGVLMSRESKRIPWTSESVLLLMLTAWMFITTLFAQIPDLAWFKWDRVWKIMLFVFLTLMLINDKQRLNLLIWVIALSIAFYGVKGGIFTIRSGGAHMVLGPERSFIGTHGEIGTALNMTIPLLRYLPLNVSKRWISYALGIAMALTAVAVLGTHSRGAFIGLGAVLAFLFLKSRRRIMLTLVLGAAVYAGLNFMPAEWEERMQTILNWEQSGAGRISAWEDAVDVANTNPLTGGGFEMTAGKRATHSIYFQMLGEHGYVGVVLWILLALSAWMSASWVKRKSKRDDDTKWMADLAAMIQVSAVGYAVGGAFISLAYFDLIYHLIGVVVILKVLLIKHLAEKAAEAHANKVAIEGGIGEHRYMTPSRAS